MSELGQRLPLVTVGIPTYRRPELLKRSVTSVLVQTYANLEIIVSSNDGLDTDSRTIVSNLAKSSSRVRFLAQEKNIGPIANFEKLLAEANGEFFMWLADDDEISAQYVETLVSLLLDNNDAVTAAGDWELLDQKGSSMFPSQTDLSQEGAFERIRSLVEKPDDSGFYGLHRVAPLRTCKFRRYSWPNRAALHGLAHPFLIRLTGLGPTVFAPRGRAIWRNHEFGAKEYTGVLSGSPISWIFAILRITNYHLLLLMEASASLRLTEMLGLIPPVLESLFKQLTRPLLEKLGGYKHSRTWQDQLGADDGGKETT